MTMLKPIFKAAALGFLVAAIAGLPLTLSAQTNTNTTPPTAKKSVGAKTNAATAKQIGGPFRGKLVALDKVKKTITVGKRTFQITSETKLFKAGKPATFDDAVVGELASGGFKLAADGKLIATKVTFGPVAASADAAKKSAAKTDSPKKPVAQPETKQ